MSTQQNRTDSRLRATPGVSSGRSEGAAGAGGGGGTGGVSGGDGQGQSGQMTVHMGMRLVGRVEPTMCSRRQRTVNALVDVASNRSVLKLPTPSACYFLLQQNKSFPLLGLTHSNQGDQVFTSIHDREETNGDPSERLRFVAGWFRVLGFILVGVWILVGLVSVAVGLTTRQTAAQGLIFGVGGAALGILLTAPLYFWFSAIASGVASLVDHAKEKKQ